MDPGRRYEAAKSPKSRPKSLICSAIRRIHARFYSNAFTVGVGLVANLGRFDGWRSRATFLWSMFRHALVIALKVPLAPKTRTLRFSGLSIEYKEFTGELGNI